MFEGWFLSGRRLQLRGKIPNLGQGDPVPITPMALSFPNAEGPGRTDSRDKHHAEQIRCGVHSSFESLFRTYYPRLCRFALRLTGSRMTAEEAVQEVFVRIWKNRASWNPTGSVRAYLYAAVKNQALTSRKQGPAVEVDEQELEKVLSELPGPEEELHHKEMQAAVEEAIELLPPRCRLVFLMHRVEGLTYEEIAEILAISLKTVETQMGRALKILRRLLAHHLPSPKA